MYIIFFIALFILIRFILRSLFDNTWRANAQEKFDSIKKEREFWYLMNTEDIINDQPGENNTNGLNVRDVFRLYVFSLARGLKVGDFFKQKEVGFNNLNKNIIREKDSWVHSINLLGEKIDEKEKIIEQIVKDNNISITKSDIHKKFGKEEKESLGFSVEMKKFVELFLRLVKDKNDGNQILIAMKEFKEISRKYEFDSAGEYVKNLNILVSVKMGQFEILETITNLICEKIEDKNNSLELQKHFNEREQMEMLQWCVINYSNTWLNTNGIQRFGWYIANYFFLK